MFCQNNITALSTESDIGFISLFKYLQYLLASKKSGIESDEVKTFNSTLSNFNLDSLKNMSDKQISAKIAQLLEIFQKRNSSLESKKQKLIDLQIVNSGELSHAEEQLTKIQKILKNQNFTNSIKLIQNRMRNNVELTEEDQIKYSFFKTLENQSSYLQNFKIGTMKQVGNKSQIKKVVSKISKQMKQDIEMDIKLTSEQSIELDRVLSVWTDDQSRIIVGQLDRKFNRDMNKSKLNLKQKVIKSLMNFLDINYKRAIVILSDKNFRTKMFGSINMEDVQNKINVINNELNEHSIIKSYLNTSNQKIALCPFCSFTKSKRTERT